MTTLDLTLDRPSSLSLDALVIGVYSADGAPEPAPGAEDIDAAFGGQLVEVLTRLGATGSAAEVTKIATLGAVPAPVVVAVGLGSAPGGSKAPAGADPQLVRRAVAAAIRSLAGATSAGVVLPPADQGDPAAVRAVIRATAEGALLGTYEPQSLKSTTAEPPRGPVPAITLVLAGDTGDDLQQVTESEISRATVVVDAVRLARDWVNAPANDLRPQAFAEQVADAATTAGLTVEILDEHALATGGYGGLLAVGSGSDAPPRLVRLVHTPAESDRRPVAFVGKGITFDTGGISIKPAQSMWDMKTDMAGAAAVAAVLIAAARLDCPVPLVGYLAIAENMPSGGAYRPSDVVRIYGGRTVEVLNTDAEGRMVLADAMVRASEDSPTALVEVSTLTGGQIVALGKSIAGLMGTAELLAEIKAAGDRTGEALWPMPLPEDVRSTLESPIADTLQVSANMERSGHMLQGGAFLAGFVPEDLPWAHLDIAGPSTISTTSGHLARGGTGFPVRALLDYLDTLADTVDS